MTATVLQSKRSDASLRTSTTTNAPVDPPPAEHPADSLPPAYDQAPSPTAPHKPTIGERFHKLSSKAGWPLNKAANVIGAEGWWPDTVEKESLKAARILYSFTSMSAGNVERRVMLISNQTLISPVLPRHMVRCIPLA